MQVSLFASSVRPQLYDAFFTSLLSTSIDVDYEVVFAGNNPNHEDSYPYRYIKTENIKPAQCYEIARRECKGEVVVWVADDCEFPNDIIGKAYRYWKEQDNDTLILSIQTKESGYHNDECRLFDMKKHTFQGYNQSTPLMAPLGMMSREYLDKLGGFDRRYVAGQYENDIVMRAYAMGGTVEIFGDENNYIEIDHLGKSLAIGECRDRASFQRRPFASGYQKDREVLESSWGKNGTFPRKDEFEPYEDKDLLTVSQSNKGQWD